MAASSPRHLARIAQLSQIGMEMAIPVAIGYGIDYWLGTIPWFTVIGALLGPVIGFVHMLNIIRPKSEPPTPKRTP